MADPNVLVRKFLLQDSTLVALLGGNNIFGGALPEKFNPGFDASVTAPAIVICTEGGPPAHPEIPMATSRVKVWVWAGVNQYALARQIYAEVKRWLHGQCMVNLSPDGFILSSLEAVAGQDLTDPDTGWATVVSFYRITARDSAS